MASRIIAPKMASLMAQSSSKLARPAIRTNLNINPRKLTTASASFRTPLRTLKRQQASQVLSVVTRNVIARQTARPYSNEIANALVQVSQNIGMGSAAIGLGGAGIGIGLVFSALLTAVARNPSLRGQLFSYAILGFAFVEAIGLFDLMVAMMCKYV
ncbi:ATP synthase subunit 9, mitochondrial [Erysiphe necator]|uniref:ATP synthase subunit 9, mitochondrial n=1 Tax=Uncinula necator TaxID=52586 RepID=A0A0B1P584_UNCNE|nr:ATP synthase subunit 9, mitochondrial [Erysiphe necator]KHJ33827.1 putative atp synthase protein 9 [Erysiphe necator]